MKMAQQIVIAKPIQSVRKQRATSPYLYKNG